MTVAAIAAVVTSAAYLGFQLTVRVLVYPQFSAVPAASFAAYEDRHTRLVTYVVGPLFVLDGLAVVAAFVARPGVPTVVAGAGLAVVLLLTALLAVPAHRTLGRGYDAAVHRRLLHVDTARVIAAAGSVAGAVWNVVG